MLQEEEIFRTPLRQRRSSHRGGNAERRRSLFTGPKDFDDEFQTLSPTSSEIGSPFKSPVVGVTHLENNFNQLLLNKTPTKGPIRSPQRISPRIKGIRCLSEDTDIIKRNTFYGGRALSTTVGPVDGKALLASIRSTVPLKARTRLFPDDAPKERKKRGRTASFLDSAKRPKKKPRLQESIPSNQKGLLLQKLNKLKRRLSIQKDAAKKRRTSNNDVLDELTVFHDKRQKKEQQGRTPKQRYNWEFFNSGSEKKYFRSLNSSVAMTPPSTNKKQKLMNKYDIVCLPTPQKDSDTDDHGDTDGLIEDLKRDVMLMIQDDDKGMQDEVNDLLLQLDNTCEDGIEGENVDPQRIPSTPETSQSPLCTPITTPSNYPKLFPIFTKTPLTPCQPVNSSSISKKTKLRGVGNDQLLLDCGQNKLREVQCPECELLYVQGVPEDEAHHMKYHSTATQMIYNGFKNEKIVGVDGTNKVIMVRKMGEDIRAWKKAMDFKRVVDAELGAPPGDAQPDHVFLFVKQKRVIGLLCATMIKVAHRLLPLSDNVNADPNLPALCSEEIYPAKCGITRLWVLPTARKKGVAISMMDALRRNFMYGTVLKLDDIAMSSPTVDGRIFASKYFNRNDFLVY